MDWGTKVHINTNQQKQQPTNSSWLYRFLNKTYAAALDCPTTLLFDDDKLKHQLQSTSLTADYFLTDFCFLCFLMIKEYIIFEF